MYSKLDKLCKVKRERDSLDTYREMTSSVWYGLAVDEAVSTTLHALAFGVDPSSMIQHLEHSRTQFRKAENAMPETFKQKEKDHISQRTIMQRAKAVILTHETGFGIFVTKIWFYFSR